MQLLEALRGQAGACARLGSPMYADLLARVADDVEAGGPAAVVLRGHEDDPGPSALALRLMGSVHRMVLERRAGALGTFYPSVGGTYEPEGCWTAFRAVLDEQPATVAEWLDRPPQTNEVGRSAALMAGLLFLTAETGLPIRLFEIGSSGGLNLLADRFRYGDDAGATHGADASPVVLEGAWSGAGPWPGAWPDVVERVGSDVMPVDARSTEGRLALTAYVWPDQTARHERLRGALALAQQTPYTVHRRSAIDFVRDLEPAPGTLSVVWHSVMWQYLGRDEQDAVTARLAELDVAHLFLEPTRRTPDAEHEFLLCVETPGRGRRVLAHAEPHGMPTTWELL